MTTGERIGIIAKERGINLHKLSDLAGISYNTLYSIVKRRSAKVDYATIRKIALALSLHPIELYGEAENELIGYGMDLMERATKHNMASTESEKKILSAIRVLNEDGQLKAIERVVELTEIPKYKKEPPQD